MSIDNLKKLIENSSLHLSNVSSFNDPFELNFSVDLCNDKNILADELRKYTGKDYKYLLSNFTGMQIDSISNSIWENIVDNFKICCFSQIQDNILMWSHYADQHKGACVTFDVSLFNPSVKLYKINYTNDFPVFNFPINDEARYFDLLLTKAWDWRYEQEVRAITYDSSNKFIFDKRSLIKITFGCMTTDSIIHEIRALTENYSFNDIVFFQMKKATRQYKLETNELKI